MKDEFREALNKLSYSPPSKSVIRNFDVKMYSNKEDIIEGLVEQINNTVLFRKTLDFCLSQGIKKYIDVRLFKLTVFRDFVRSEKKV